MGVRGTGHKGGKGGIVGRAMMLRKDNGRISSIGPW